MKLKFILITAMLLSTSILSAASDIKSLSISELVGQFYEKKSVILRSDSHFTNRLARPIDCFPSDAPSCVDAACDKLGSFGCDDISEIKAVDKACRGNYNGNCLNSACDKLGSFGCSDISEIEKVARACVGNTDSDCLDSVCRRLGSFGCDDMSEIETVLKTCAGF